MAHETPPLSTATLLAEFNEKLDRIASTCAQASLQAARTARLIDAGQQLSARDRMALVDVVDKLHRLYAQMSQIKRPPSLTVVADAPQTISVEASGPARGDEISVVNIRLPWAPSKMIAVPNRHLRYVVLSLIGFAAGGGLMRLLHAVGYFR